jgi:hypothetical protein
MGISGMLRRLLRGLIFENEYAFQFAYLFLTLFYLSMKSYHEQEGHKYVDRDQDNSDVIVDYNPEYNSLLLLIQMMAVYVKPFLQRNSLTPDEIFQTKIRKIIRIHPNISCPDAFIAEKFVEDLVIKMTKNNFDDKCKLETLVEINHLFRIFIDKNASAENQELMAVYDYEKGIINLPLTSLNFNATRLSQILSAQLKGAINALNNNLQYRCRMYRNGYILSGGFIDSKSGSYDDCLTDSAEADKTFYQIKRSLDYMFYLIYYNLIKDSKNISHSRGWYINRINYFLQELNYSRTLYSVIASPNSALDLEGNRLRETVFFTKDGQPTGKTNQSTEEKQMLKHNYTMTLFANSYNNKTKEMIYSVTRPDESLVLDLILSVILRLGNVMSAYKGVERNMHISMVLDEIFSPYSRAIKYEKLIMKALGIRNLIMRV